MIAALSRRGHEVILVSPPAPRPQANESNQSSSRLRRLLPRAVAELLELGYSVPAYLRLLRAWRKHRPDILYERYNLHLLSGIWLRAHTGIPMILEVNAPLLHERDGYGGLSWLALARWTERRVWRHCDVLLPVTAVLAGHLRAAAVADERIHVIANGVDSRRFSAISGSQSMRGELGLDGKLVLGFTGFIRPWHGLTRVLEAMAALPDRPELHLLVVGDGPGRAELEERARVLGMTDRLTILGAVDREVVGSYVGIFDIALQPRVVAYASPLKLFEYMAMGRAIIAPNQPNIREVLRHERDALLFDPGDPLGIQAAIMRLCADPDLRVRLGKEAARRIGHGRFTWNENAAKVEGIAKNLLDTVERAAAVSARAALSTNDR
jgi:glycosyltransferase involved in cell wall biosynthesis